MGYVVRLTRMLHLSPSYIVTSRHEPFSPFWLGNSGQPMFTGPIDHFNPLHYDTTRSSKSVVPCQDRTHNLMFTQKRLCWGGYQCRDWCYTGVVIQSALGCPRLQSYFGLLHALTLHSSVSSTHLAPKAQHHHTELTPSDRAAMAIPLNGPIATLVTTLKCYAFAGIRP
jgi:hypothetical protein